MLLVKLPELSRFITYPLFSRLHEGVRFERHLVTTRQHW
jgi:hypothetical protein